MFDLVLRGGTLIDGTGSRRPSGRRGRLRRSHLGGRRSVGDRSPARTQVLECAGRVVAPGFIDPHGHSDGSVLVDGALASHLHQGFTTQLSGNCGASVAPVTDAGRDHVDLLLRPDHVEAGLADVRGVPRPSSQNGRSGRTSHSSSARARSEGRCWAPTPRRRRPTSSRRWSARWRRRWTPARSACRRASSTRPGCTHAPPSSSRSCTRRRRAAGCTRPTCGTRPTVSSPPSTRRSRRSVTPGRAPASRSRISNAPRVPCGAAPAMPLRRLEAARADGLDVAADQYPYTAANTSLETILPPALLALGVDECVAALRDRDTRDRAWSEMRKGNSSWENVTADPGLGRHSDRVRAEPPRLVGPVSRRARPGDGTRTRRCRLRRADRRPT